MKNRYSKADICVLCFSSDNKNYGANLICYSMGKVLEKTGYSANILNFYRGKTSNEEKRGASFSDFRNKYIKLTPPIRYFFQFYLLNFFYKVFITGSDQVFNVFNTKPYEKQYFLDFVHKSKGKIAFSASFGMEQFVGNKKLIQKVKKLLSRFDDISVREKSAIDVFKKTFGFDYNSKLTIDPTLMLGQEDYIELLKDSNLELPKKYIAYYMLSPEYGIKVQETKEGLLKTKNNFNLPLINILYDENKTYYKVGQWLNYIKNAEFIITDSFHGVCFSIIYKKKFIFIDRVGSTRINNVLELLGIKNLSYKSFEDIVIQDIDYSSVDRKLEALKNESYEYLKNSIGKFIDSNIY